MWCGRDIIFTSKLNNGASESVQDHTTTYSRVSHYLQLLRSKAVLKPPSIERRRERGCVQCIRQKDILVRSVDQLTLQNPTREPTRCVVPASSPWTNALIMWTFQSTTLGRDTQINCVVALGAAISSAHSTAGWCRQRLPSFMTA